MKVCELYDFLSEKAPTQLSCDWDNDGLMCCPDPQREIKKVLVTLDITEKAVEFAQKGGFEVIISHHPLIFKPLRSIESPKLIKLIRGGICAMSFHTRLDKASGGVNDCLAECLELSEISPFGTDGLGRIGNLPREMLPAEFALFAAKCLGSPFAHSVEGKSVCRRVAVVGGDGKDYINDALMSGADAYLTGTVSYNSLVDVSETPLTVIAAGHYYTEKPVCKRIAEFVNEADADIYTEIFECNPILTRSIVE